MRLRLRLEFFMATRIGKGMRPHPQPLSPGDPGEEGLGGEGAALSMHLFVLHAHFFVPVINGWFTDAGQVVAGRSQLADHVVWRQIWEEEKKILTWPLKTAHIGEIGDE